jgi:hypothetical protein
VDRQATSIVLILYQVCRLGYDPVEDTWEEKYELPIHFIRRYWRAKGLSTLEWESTLY